MPRLVPSSSIVAPRGGEVVPYGEGSSDTTSSTVRLSCLSPNGRAVHSLNLYDSIATIETHRLPLIGTVVGDTSIQDGSVPAVVRTTLPDHVYSALERYPPLELCCVDIDTQATASATKARGLQAIPRLGLYTKKDVFVLELGYLPVDGATEVEGEIVNVDEPFLESLMGTGNTTDIIRIRPAPQQHMGYATMCPPLSMAMLAHDAMTNEYSISLSHGGTSVTKPLVHGMEDIEEQAERVTDFCFCQSSAFPVLSSLTVALLKGSGNVYFGTPILFRGTVVPRESVKQTLDYFENELQDAEPSSAKWREYRVAKQYILDAFQDDGRSPFLTAQERSAAFEWPVQIQGPVLAAPDSDELESLASCIEPLPANDLTGLAIGHLGYKLEFGILSPTTLVPRFSLEQDVDTLELDGNLMQGAIVNCVDLTDDEFQRSSNCEALALVRDPIMDSVVHYVTPKQIMSISTNALKIAANSVQQLAQPSSGLFSPPSKRKDIPPRTTAWPCFDVSSTPNQQNTVVGVVVSGDVHFGHVLVSRLSNGSMASLNLTETRQLQEIEAFGDSDQPRQTTGGKELEALRETAPLVEVLEPMMNKMVAGLRGMGKIVGSATPVENITPELLAASAAVKEQCDKDVLLPVMEMSEHVKMRKRELVVMFNNQMHQLKSLRETVAKIKERASAIKEKAEVANSNAQALAQRSASVLQSSTDLLPSITQAEYDYFQELKRLDAKTRQWQGELERLDGKASSLADSVKEGMTAGPATLPPESVANSKKLLSATGAMLSRQKAKMTDAEEHIERLSALAGLENIDPFPSGPLQ